MRYAEKKSGDADRLCRGERREDRADQNAEPDPRTGPTHLCEQVQLRPSQPWAPYLLEQQRIANCLLAFSDLITASLMIQ